MTAPKTVAEARACCADPSPAVHRGQRYCMACDSDLPTVTGSAAEARDDYRRAAGTAFGVEARTVTTTAWGCRATQSRRWYVIGPFDGSAHHRGIAGVAYRLRRDALSTAEGLNRAAVASSALASKVTP